MRMRQGSGPRPVGILPPVRRRSARSVDAMVPPRLGRSFRWLLAAEIVSNLGDGVAIAAGPLLVASLTGDPFLVSLALLSEYLPTLLFGLVAGAAADRFDRRLTVAVVNVVRAIVLTVLAFTIATSSVEIWIVLVVLFAMGTAEAFADTAGSSLVPNLVAREDLGTANARLEGAYILSNQLIGPPIGAFLFVIGMAVPFATNAACFALGAVLVLRVVGTQARPSATSAEPVEPTEPTSIWTEMREGLAWLAGHAPMRTLALTIFAFNITYGAAFAVLVLYAGKQLGMDEVGFGLLTTAVALGGVVGTASYGALERRFRLADIMRVGLVIETLTHLVLALTTSAAVALVTLGVFGAHAFVWGTTSTVVRQRAVPDAMLGRVTGIYHVALVGGLVIGTPLGGLLASAYGITAPFWFGFFGSAVLVIVLWRQFDRIVHAGDITPGEQLPVATT
jgi:MFS family permease